MSPAPRDVAVFSAALSPWPYILEATGLEGGARHILGFDFVVSYDVLIRLVSGEPSEGDNDLLDPVVEVLTGSSTFTGTSLS